MPQSSVLITERLIQHRKVDCFLRKLTSKESVLGYWVKWRFQWIWRKNSTLWSWPAKDHCHLTIWIWTNIFPIEVTFLLVDCDGFGVYFFSNTWCLTWAYAYIYIIGMNISKVGVVMGGLPLPLSRTRMGGLILTPIPAPYSYTILILASLGMGTCTYG